MSVWHLNGGGRQIVASSKFFTIGNASLFIRQPKEMAMGNINFNASNETFRQLLGNGISFYVPPFQRDYSWEEENWEELWEDIVEAFAEGPDAGHYLGYLVLNATTSKKYIIIDGQQRLATISLLIMAALANFKSMIENGIDAERNRLRMEQLRASYIGYLDAVSLVPRSKLNLNRHNDRYYQTFIVPLGTLPQSGINQSEKLLRKSFKWFEEKLRVRFPHTEGGAQDLVEFIDSMVDRLFFTVIRVDDELNAFKVFETLNARGVRLSAADLLKNHFFSLISGRHETEIRAMEEAWSAILRMIADTREDFTEYLRAYWNSFHPITRKANLYKGIRREIGEPGQVFATLREMEALAPVYMALRGYDDGNLWNDEEREAARVLRLFNVKQPIPMLMAAYGKFFEDRRETFSGILRDMAAFSLRYNVIMKGTPNEQEGLYNEIALGIMRGDITGRHEARQYLMRLYPADDAFKAAFRKKTFNISHAQSRKVVRYILARIERQSCGAAIEEEYPTIEHILPVNAGSGWEHIEERSREELAARLGNMALLEPALNREVGNGPYDVKKAAFLHSQYQTTRDIPANAPEVWDQRAIDRRQDRMANLASGIWRLN